MNPETSQSSSDVKFEIGHVLFIDIVGYSKLLIEEQRQRLRQLTEIVLATEQVRKAPDEQLVRLPTGDGMALVFHHSAEEPARCALEVAQALKSHPEIAVRIGIHSGPVSEVTDVSGRNNIAGAGINMAQRVMDCGDAGHILLSKRVADDLSPYRQWSLRLHDLGEVEVKHGVRLHIFNLYNEELGNPEVPEKLGKIKGRPAPAVSERGEELWVAVLPFRGAGDAEMESFADGLREEITTGLSRFRYLSVVASAAAERVKGEAGDERALGAKLGARYVLQGSIRKGGSGIRVSTQLVDTKTGAQLWAETYNRDLQTSTIFAAQDDVAARIVATVADSYGVLVHSLRDAARQKDDSDLTPAEWQFQYFAYREQITPSNYAALKTRLESAVKRNDRQSDLCACLAQIYVDEYAFGFGGDATSLDRALTAARRGVELDRANQFAMVALAQTHFFRQDLAAFGPAAERAMALNPLNTDAIGILGLQIVHMGEFERGTAIVRRAMELNANHAGWMHFAPLWDHFHYGAYEEALECANRVDVPGLFWPYLVMASACGHLGRRAEAAAAVRDLLALDPEFAAHARSNVGTWHFASGLMEPILEGLRKAGLSIPETDDSSGSPKPKASARSKADQAKSGTDAEVTRANEGFWLAVLPFKYSGGNADLTALADGMTEEIVTGLSRFSYLRVIALLSTSRYANQAVDIRSAGKELGARYVMEGSLRQAGARLRVAVQLVDTISGAHLWAETYDRAFSPDEIFSLQDDLVPRIVSTVADMHGVLPRSMSEVVRQKSADQMSPYEALLRSFGYNERFTPEDLTEVRACLERAVQQAPNNAECWAMLSLMYANEYGHWDNATPDSLDRSLRAARKAVEAAPLHSLPYYALAQALYFKKEFTAFRVAAERAISLNPMDGATAAFMGMLIAYSGDWERGCALSDKGCQLNPNHPGWYCYPAWHDSYRKKDYRKALDLAFQLNAPQNYYTHAVLAMCYAQLGRMEEARKALADMLALKPNYAEVARELHGRWIQPDLVEQLMDGLRKAGLEIPASGGTQRPQNIGDNASAKSVAVLPFVNMSADKLDEYLSDGMTEELINALARVPGLRVPGRTSCFAFKGKTEANIFREVGDQLHVNAVLEGSIRKAGDKLRVTAQLVNVADGYHLWSEDYDGDVRDIFTFQSNVAQRVVEALQIKLGVEAARALAKKPTDNPEAHRLYLLGRYEFGKYGEAGWTSSIRYYEEALKLDPNYALAYCGLADTYAYMGGVVMPSKEAVVKEKEFAQRALQLEPQLAEAHLSLACALAGAFDWPNAEVEFDRAIELNPNLAWAYEIYAWFLGGLGRLDEAIAKVKKAIELDPLNSFFQAALAYFLYYARRYDDAIVQINKTLEVDPASTLARHSLGCCLLWKGDTAGAIAEFQRSKIMVTGAWYQGLLGYAYAISGDRPKAEQMLRELDEMAKRQYVNTTAFADIHLGLGEKEKALDWLEKSYQDQESACWYLKVDPIYDSVRNEPRFQAILKKVGLE